MTPSDLEARIWRIAGRQMTGAQVDAITCACEEFISERLQHAPRRVLHHTSGTDLWPVIGVLADALLGAEDGPVDELARKRAQRGAA